MKPFAYVVAACCALAALTTTGATPTGPQVWNCPAGCDAMPEDEPSRPSTSTDPSGFASTAAVVQQPAYEHVWKGMNAIFKVSNLALHDYIQQVIEERPWVNGHEWKAMPGDASEWNRFYTELRERMSRITGLPRQRYLDPDSPDQGGRMGVIHATAEMLLGDFGFKRLIERTTDENDALDPSHVPGELQRWSSQVEDVRFLFLAIKSAFDPSGSSSRVLSEIMQAAADVSIDLTTLLNFKGEHAEARLLSTGVLTSLMKLQKSLEESLSARRQRLDETRKALKFLNPQRQTLWQLLAGVGQFFYHMKDPKLSFVIYRPYNDVGRSFSAAGLSKKKKLPAAADERSGISAEAYDAERRQKLSNLQSMVAQAIEILGGPITQIADMPSQLSKESISEFMSNLNDQVVLTLFHYLHAVPFVGQPFYGHVSDFLRPSFADKMDRAMRKLADIARYFAENIDNSVEARVVTEAYVKALEEMSGHLTAFARDCNGDPALAENAFNARLVRGTPDLDEYLRLASENGFSDYPQLIR